MERESTPLVDPHLGGGRGRGGGLAAIPTPPQAPAAAAPPDEGNRLNHRGLVVMLTCMVNAVQIIAALLVMGVHWRDEEVCDQAHRLRWKIWASVATLRLALFTGVVIAAYNLEKRGIAVPNSLLRARNSLDAMGLVWFLVGNMWLGTWFLVGDEDSACADPERSPIYNLCFAMLLITYLQLTLPCVIAILMVPVLCLCLPCVIRILTLISESKPSGASEEDLAQIPVKIFGEDLEELGESDIAAVVEDTCPICLIEYEKGDRLRCLPCSHAYHDACATSWLKLSGTCPICRASIASGRRGDESRAASSARHHGDESDNGDDDDDGLGAILYPGFGLGEGHALL
jgi:hypothetical protein